jgi:hypothetical protein
LQFPEVAPESFVEEFPQALPEQILPEIEEDSDGNVSVTNAVAHDRNPESEMVITAIGTSWVQLNRADGSEIAAWLMRSGEVYTVTADDDVYLTTGNAGGLSIALGNGASMIPGEQGETIREMLLDPALISKNNQ